MTRLFVSLGLAALLLSGRAEGHGVLKVPPSRSWECQSVRARRKNTGCDIPFTWGIQNWGGFPESGPLYGNIASAGMSAKSALDEQSATRWFKYTMTPGENQFQWQYKRDGTNHPTVGFKYFITVEAWNPNGYLHKNAFEEEPFCSFDLGGAEPPLTVNHVCNVPHRTGYHVILAVWYVTNGRSFMQVVDADFSGEGGGGGGDSAVAPLSMENYNNILESALNFESGNYGEGRAGRYVPLGAGLPAMPERPSVPIGQTIWLQGSVGEYVHLNNGPLQSEDRPLSDTEKFDVVDAGNGYVALRASNGMYVAAERTLNRVNPPLVADRTSVGSWEKFEWVPLGPYSVALKARVNGKYVEVYSSGTGNPLRAATYRQVAFSWGSTSW